MITIPSEVVIAGSKVDTLLAGMVIGFAVLAGFFYYKWQITKRVSQKAKMGRS